MFGLGITEILVLGVLALVLIGPDQLPELARNLARFLNDLKRTTNDFTHDLKNQINVPPPSDYLPPVENLVAKTEEPPATVTDHVEGVHHSHPAQYPVPEEKKPHDS